MNVLVVTQYFWPENFRINDLVVGLRERGHAVTVLTGYPNYPDGVIYPEFCNRPRDFSEFEGADIIRVPLLARGASRIRLVLNYVSFAITGSLVGTWKLRSRHFDVIFVYEPSPITVGIPAIFLRYLKRAPVVFWVLDLWPETLRALGVVKSRWVLWLVGRLVSFIYHRCDLILGQSRSSMHQIALSCRKDQRIAYFPSWAEAVFDLDTVAPAAEVPAAPDCFTVMFAGNVGEAQDFPAVLAAAELLKSHQHIRWVIVGGGRLAAWLNLEIDRRQLQGSVLALGRHPVERMPAFYKCADALLVCLKDAPIFSMTIPGKLQSYLASGVPIIAMMNGEGAELVVRSHSGVACAAGDSNGLAAAVLKLAALSPECRLKMAHNGREISAAEFNRQKLMVRLERWFEQVHERKR